MNGRTFLQVDNNRIFYSQVEDYTVCALQGYVASREGISDGKEQVHNIVDSTFQIYNIKYAYQKKYGFEKKRIYHKGICETFPLHKKKKFGSNFLVLF